MENTSFNSISLKLHVSVKKTKFNRFGLWIDSSVNRFIEFESIYVSFDPIDSLLFESIILRQNVEIQFIPLIMPVNSIIYTFIYVRCGVLIRRTFLCTVNKTCIRGNVGYSNNTRNLAEIVGRSFTRRGSQRHQEKNMAFSYFSMSRAWHVQHFYHYFVLTNYQ